MSRARFLLITRQLFFEILIVMVMFGAFYCFIGRQVCNRVGAEFSYRARFGAEWKQRYAEEMHVSVAKNREQLLIGTAGLIAVTGLGYLVYRQLLPKRSLRRHS